MQKDILENYDDLILQRQNDRKIQPTTTYLKKINFQEENIPQQTSFSLIMDSGEKNEETHIEEIKEQSPNEMIS